MDRHCHPLRHQLIDSRVRPTFGHVNNAAVDVRAQVWGGCLLSSLVGTHLVVALPGHLVALSVELFSKAAAPFDSPTSSVWGSRCSRLASTCQCPSVDDSVLVGEKGLVGISLTANEMLIIFPCAVGLLGISFGERRLRSVCVSVPAPLLSALECRMDAARLTGSL